MKTKTTIFLILTFTATLLQAAEKPKPITPEKARYIGYVENYFVEKPSSVDLKKTIAWSDVQKDDKGNGTIRYEFEALLKNGKRSVLCLDFTFDPDGNCVKTQSVEPTKATPSAKPVKIDAKASQANSTAGWKLMMTEQKPEAARDKFRLALEQNPKNEAALNGLGFACFNLGEEEEAIAAWEKAIELDPKATGSMNGLMQLYEARGDKENAEKYRKMMGK